MINQNLIFIITYSKFKKTHYALTDRKNDVIPKRLLTEKCLPFLDGGREKIMNKDIST